MIRNHLQPALTDEQKGRICGVLSVGCDRETAANVVGCSTADIGRAMQQDPAFTAHVRRTEASAEVAHVRNVQEAAKDAKNWRASVWWLERHSPERFGSRSAGAVTIRHLKQFVKRLVDVLSDEFATEEAKHRAIARIDQEIAALDELIRFAAAGAVPPVPDSSQDEVNSISDVEPTSDGEMQESI
jgi:hypothetical protein